MLDKDLNPEIGVGATDRLSLRVSVAALARVVFEHPASGERMLALERKATLLDSKDISRVEVKSQPFGGALRIFRPEVLRQAIGDFHFDSQRSRSEQDFRIFIEPAAWTAVQQFCLQHFDQRDDAVLEAGPERELTEEFSKTLDVETSSGLFHSDLVGIVIEDHPSATRNYFARGALTARLYRIFETRLLDSSLAQKMVARSESCSDQELRDLAILDREAGRRGWANTVLTLPWGQVSAFYAALSVKDRNQAVTFQDHCLDETVAAILEGVPVQKDWRS